MSYDLSYLNKPKGATHFLASGYGYKHYYFSWFKFENDKCLYYRCDSDDEYCDWYPTENAFFASEAKVISRLMEIE